MVLRTDDRTPRCLPPYARTYADDFAVVATSLNAPMPDDFKCFQIRRSHHVHDFAPKKVRFCPIWR